MGIPDVTGRRLEKALELLKEGRIEKTAVVHTAAPRLRGAGYDAKARVVRQSIADEGTVVLLVCNMDVKSSESVNTDIK